MAELGSYYISVIPSLRGAAGQITSQLKGIDTSAAGSVIGKQLSTTTAKAFSLDAVAEKFKSVGASFTEVGTKLTKGITMPVLGAATAAGGLVAALGFKRLVGIDTARAQFKGLGYDADAVMKQVDAGVTNTSLSMAEGAAAATSILATGAVPLEGLEAQIKRVANVSAAYGVDASQANYLLNNVLTKQKVTWGDLSQMQQNNIPIVTALADEFGYTGEEIQKMAENGEISIDMLNQALDSKAGAAAEEYANSWSGVTKNILSNLGKIGAKMMEPSFEIIKDKAAALLEYMKSPEFAAAAERIGQSISEFVTKAIDFIGRLIQKWNDLSPGMKKAVAVMAGVAVAAGPILIVIGKVATGIGTILSVVETLVPIFKGAATAVKLLWAALTFNPVMAIVTAIAAVVAALVLFFTKTELGKQIWQGFVNFLGAAWEWIKNLAVTVWQGIADFFSGLWESISATATAAWSAITAVFTTVWNGIKAVVMAVWNGIKTYITTYINVVKTVITTVLNAISAVWNAVWNGIKTVVMGVWNGIQAVVQGAINAVKAVITAVMQAIRGDWSGAWNTMKNLIGTIWNGIKSGVTSGISAVMGLIRGLPGKITGVFSGAGTWLLDSGKKIIGGLVDGIKSMVSKVTDAVGGVLSAARNLLPFSPAKEGPFSGKGWTLYSGRSIVEALAEGVTQKRALFRDAVEDVMSQGEFALENAAGLSASFAPQMAAPLGSAYTHGGTGGTGSAVTQNNTIIAQDPQVASRFINEDFRLLLGGA